MPGNVVERASGFGARVTIAGQGVWLGTFATRAEAERAVAVAKAGRPSLPEAAPTVLVAEWAERFMDLYPGSRSEETARHNAQMLAPFVRVYGRRDLRSVSRLEAQAWALRSPGSVRYLRLMWGKALRAGLVESSPWDHVEVVRRRREQAVPSVSQVRALAGVAAERGWESFAGCILFAAYSGLRLSEVADVQAGDVLAGGRRVLVRGKRRAGEAAPRERTAAVFGPGRDALVGAAPEVGLVWLSPQGRRLNRTVVSKLFGVVRAEVGFAGTFHSLRRFHATWLRDQGADPRDIAQQLGHTDSAGRPYPELVDRVYSHPSAEVALGRLEAVADL